MHIKHFLIPLFFLFPLLSSRAIVPGYTVESDSTVLQRPANTFTDSLFFTHIPEYVIDTMPAIEGTTLFTSEYQPSGSSWHDQCIEEEVYLARMTHMKADSLHWDLSFSKAGAIYSFIGPYGEGVAPQWRNWDFNTARWVDEVWQIVSLNTNLHNADEIPAEPGSTLGRQAVPSMRYFIHGAGVYMNDTLFGRVNKPFYSPLMASWYDSANHSLYLTNWGQQAHVPSIHKSQALYTSKFKDLGNGIVEATYSIQNFGDHSLNYFNLPWGGVRRSNLPQCWQSKTDHTLELTEKNFTGTDPGMLLDIDQSGGYFIFSGEGQEDSRPAMAVVYGTNRHLEEMAGKYNMLPIRLRWGFTGPIDYERDYTVFVVIPIFDLQPGSTFFYRMYYVNGTKKEVQERAIGLADHCDYGFIEPFPEEARLTYIHNSGPDTALREPVKLFTEPVPSNVPLFLMENTETGVNYISPDLYYNTETLPFKNPYEPSDPKYGRYQDRIVYRHYSGNIRYRRLLGYGVKVRAIAPDLRFKLLDSLVTDSSRIIIPEAWKQKIWVPVDTCDSCSAGLFPEPEILPGYTLYSDFGDNRVYEANNPVNMDYSYHVPNPAISLGNPSQLTGMAIRQPGTWSHIHFEVPGTIDLAGHGTFKIKVYYDSKDSITEPCNIGLILRKNGDGTSQYGIWKDVTVANEWIEYTFYCRQGASRNQYNQVWLFFSSPDYDNQATGQAFYIDQLTGPPLLVPEEEFKVTFRIKDLMADSLLQGISVTIGQEVHESDSNGESLFTLPAGTSSYSINHPDYENIVSSLDVQTDTVIQVSLIPSEKTVRFRINSDITGNPIPDVSVVIGASEVFSNINGEAFLHLFKGSYVYSISDPDYYSVESPLTISNDTTLKIVLVARKASVKFRIYTEDYPLNEVDVQVSGISMKTNSTGVAMFNDLSRFEDYKWSASKDGYADTAGILFLANDTTVVLNMIKIVQIGSIGSQWISLYPNPAGSRIFIQSAAIITGMEIYDVMGRLVTYEPVMEKEATFDFSGYENGLYIVRVYRGDKDPANLKVIKTE